MPTLLTPELLNEYFKRGKKNPAYIVSDKEDRACDKTIIDIYNELRIHADGEYPKDVIEQQRPSEPPEVLKYRKLIFQAITKETVSRIISCLSKIRRSSDWSIRYDPKMVPAKINKDETPEKYFEHNFPVFDSLTNWLFSVCLRNYLIDANGICVVMPLDTEVPVNEYKKPFPFIFNSDQIFEYQDNDYAIILSKDKASYLSDDGKTMKHDGKIFWVITYERIIKYTQTNSKGDLTITIDYVHGLGYMPAFKLGGMFLRHIERTFIYESRIQSIVPRLNKASRLDNDLDVSVVRHLFPEKWEFVSVDCPKCNGSGKLIKAGKEVTCDQCKGFQKIITSPFQTHYVKPASLDQQALPTPPAGYISKDTEIIKLANEFIEQNIVKALATLNMEFLAQTPLNQSGTAKEVDKDELNNFVHAVAEDLVKILDKAYGISIDIRYSFLIPDFNDRSELHPDVNVPEKYDMLSINYLMTEYATAKQSKLNPVIVAKMEEEISSKKFSTDPEMKDELMAILKLDPFAGMSTDDKLAYIQNGFITKEDAIISANIVPFVRRANNENPNFYSMTNEEQETIMEEYAAEKVTEMSAAETVRNMGAQDQTGQQTDENGNPINNANASAAT